MKKLVLLSIVAGVSVAFVACSPGKGCPSNGKNIGAERLASGDPKAVKAARKAGKFKQGKF